MLGPTNRRRSRRLLAATFLLLVAQAMLITISPIADAHYHQSGPVQVEPRGSHHLVHHATECPECLALQTLAIPCSPIYAPRTSWAQAETPAPLPGVSYLALRSTPKSPRAPPSPSGAIL